MKYAMIVLVFGVGNVPETKQKAIYRLTNEFRKSERLEPFKASADLDKIAQDHADNLARQDKRGDSGNNSHVLDGKGLKERLEDAEYLFMAASENVGITNAKDGVEKIIVEGWKKSPVHRANLVSDSATDVGIGAARSKSGKWYVVQVFAKPR
jgi:uncharacterized protein YkwD